MSSWQYLCAFLLILVIVIAIIIAAFPKCQKNWNNCKKQVHFERRHVYATVLRSQDPSSSTVLPEIPIAITPTNVPFSRGSNGVSLVVPKSGNYSISYSLQLRWTQEATASAAIHMVASNGDQRDLDGSQQQKTIAIASSDSLSSDFLAFLNKGSTLTLLSQASIADAVSVPASDSATLQTPTTLAILSITEI